MFRCCSFRCSACSLRSRSGGRKITGCQNGRIFYLTTALLLLQVLTNGLQQLVFVFPTDAAAWLDTDHGYGVGNFIVMGWIALGMVTAIITMLLKCRIPHTKITLGPPFVPVALAALYSVLYISRIPWIELLAGDMTVVQCLLLAVGSESCIRCGLIQSNTAYRALFEASTIRSGVMQADVGAPVCRLLSLLSSMLASSA